MSGDDADEKSMEVASDDSETRSAVIYAVSIRV
jgi:hypothetical protein